MEKTKYSELIVESLCSFAHFLESILVTNKQKQKNVENDRKRFSFSLEIRSTVNQKVGLDIEILLYQITHGTM